MNIEDIEGFNASNMYIEKNLICLRYESNAYCTEIDLKNIVSITIRGVHVINHISNDTTYDSLYELTLVSHGSDQHLAKCFFKKVTKTGEISYLSSIEYKYNKPIIKLSKISIQLLHIDSEKEINNLDLSIICEISFLKGKPPKFDKFILNPEYRSNYLDYLGDYINVEVDSTKHNSDTDDEIEEYFYNTTGTITGPTT
jgi:hypothetical protein